MRGKPFPFLRVRASSRITPADAGKTGSPGHFRPFEKDHPRGCGENCQSKKTAQHGGGSPPRMRGKPSGGGADDRTVRITPADAGKTFCHHKAEDCGWDHPRGCGENAFGLSQALSLSGSPPRMRGKPLCGFRVQAAARITPADAGKTYDNTVKTEPREDHPRGCGENGRKNGAENSA